MIDIRALESHVYYSQNREDLILSAFFEDTNKGFYVDVGAYDPDIDSVTKLFYAKGWRGINIEPQTDRFNKFLKKRRRDINLNVGISNGPGDLTLRSYNNQGLSTFSSEVKNEYEQSGYSGTDSYQDIVVEVLTLESVFIEHEVTNISFIKIDVEGLEREVLEGNDWARFRPEVLCIEANHINHKQPWEDMLINNEYEFVFFDGLNNYYADARTNRKQMFDYINYVVIERGGGIRADNLRIIENLDSHVQRLEKVIYDAHKELENKAETISKLEKNVQSLQDQAKSLRATTKGLLRLVKARLRRLYEK